MTDFSKFGERLDELFYENRITPETLAKEAELDLSGIYKYLRNELLPSTENVIKIAEYFNCSVDYLFGLCDVFYVQKFLPYTNFAPNFRRILKKNNCTRYKIHKETKISQQSLHSWFHGIRLPNISNLITLAKYFDCSVDYLLGRVN